MVRANIARVIFAPLRTLRKLRASHMVRQLQRVSAMGLIFVALTASVLSSHGASSSNNNNNNQNSQKKPVTSPATRIDQASKKKDLLNSAPTKQQDLSTLKNALNESDVKKLSILREAQKGKGLYGLGSATRAMADDVGRAWAGPNARLSANGKALVSQDGLRQYRFPAEKRNSPKSITGVQANIESRSRREDDWTNNGHLDIVD